MVRRVGDKIVAAPLPLPFLPVARAGKGERIISADGQPVWPFAKSGDLAVLKNIVRLSGGKVRQVSGTPGTAKPLSSELVVGLGAYSGEAARLHAHLTRRRCVIVDRWEELRGLGRRPSVLVTIPENMTVELLDWMYDGQQKIAPGIICGANVQALLEQVLIKTAAASVSGPPIRHRIEIYPTVPVQGMPGVVGAGTSKSERCQALAGEAGVLTVMTHSDGVDAFLGRDLSICARNHDTGAFDRSSAPRCGLTDFCHRHNMMVADAISSSAIFPVEQMAARILVWDVCFGVMPAFSVVDPAWGIGSRLMQSHSIGAVLTTWQITLSSAACAHHVTNLIESGMPVGKAVAQFNASRQAREHHYRMCLLGDPRIALPKLNSGFPKAVKAARSTRMSSSRGFDSGELALLRLCMIDAKDNIAERQRAVLARNALDAIETFEAAVAKQIQIADLQPLLGLAMRGGVLNYALARGKLLENWMPFAKSLHAGVPTVCPVCERQANVLQVAMRPQGVSKRRLTLCPICGVLEDAPITSNFSFTLERRTVRLGGDLPQRDWSAAVLLGSPYPADSLQLVWPQLEGGSPAPELELPADWPLGPLRLSVFLLWEANFAIASRMVRGANPKTV